MLQPGARKGKARKRAAMAALLPLRSSGGNCSRRPRILRRRAARFSRGQGSSADTGGHGGDKEFMVEFTIAERGLSGNGKVHSPAVVVDGMARL